MKTEQWPLTDEQQVAADMWDQGVGLPREVHVVVNDKGELKATYVELQPSAVTLKENT